MGVRGSSSAGVSTLKTIVTVVITLSLVTIAAAMAINTFDLVRTIDRSGPTLLERIRTLEQFTAAEASFIQDVDNEEDVKYVPGLLAGERVVALLGGSVRATVDFSDLDEGSITVDEDASTIRITLPEPVLSDVDIDEKSIRIVSRQRGAFNRLEDAFATNPTDDSPLFVAAEEKMRQAAGQSDLLARGRANTEQWLDTFLGAAGFDTVIVDWQ